MTVQATLAAGDVTEQAPPSFDNGTKTSWSAAHPISTLLVRRGLGGVVTVLIVAVIVFAATQVLPGNAVNAILGRNATPGSVKALNEQLGLDRNTFAQFWTWITGIVTGNPGLSLATREPVWDAVSPRLINSAALVVLAGFFSAVLGVVGGSFAALRRDGRFDHITSILVLTVTALPEFVVAVGLVILLSTVVLHVLPAVSLLADGARPWDDMQALVLPVATLVIVVTPFIWRMTRAAMLEALESDYVEMARLKGVQPWRVMFVHALPNALAPIIQVIGLSLLYLAGGIVIVEYVFNYPGIGQGLVQAIDNRDIPVIQFLVVTLAAFYVVINILTDLIALLASPRRRVIR